MQPNNDQQRNDQQRAQPADKKEERPAVLVAANRPYLIFLSLALTVVGLLSVGYAALDGSLSLSTRLLFGLGGGFLLAASVFGWYMLTVRLTIYEDSLTVKLMHQKIIKAEEIEYIEWTWFSARPGNCYINLKDGRTTLLQKKLFSRALQPALVAFGERNGIRQRGLEQEKQS